MVFDLTVTLIKKAGSIYRMIPILGMLGLLHGGLYAAKDLTSGANPYLTISKRNAFDLTDTPPSSKVAPPEPPKNLDLKFTGIYRLKGVEKACLALIDSSAKPPETKYLQIPVGDKQGSIEITAIDAKSGTVIKPRAMIRIEKVPQWNTQPPHPHIQESHQGIIVPRLFAIEFVQRT